MARWLLSTAALLAIFAHPAAALDEVVLANGRRYQGTIVSDTPQSIVLSFEGGTVELPRSAVVSPPYLGPIESPAEPRAEKAPEATPPPASPALPSHPLPDVATALARTRAFGWAVPVRQLPALVIERGRWQQMPCTSFWVGGFFQVRFLGDPKRPAAIELSMPRPDAGSWDRKQQMLEYLFALAPTLAVDSRFDQLDLETDSFAIGDLWFTLTGPRSQETPGRWVLTLSHEPSLGDARAATSDLQAISVPLPSTAIDPAQPRSWQRGIWTRAELAWLRDTTVPPPAADAGPDAIPTELWDALGAERIYVNAFARENGHYVRANVDWLRETAAQP